MSYGKGENQLSNIFMYLVASAISWQIVSNEERWNPRVMNEFSYDIPSIAEHKVFIKNLPIQ